MIFENPTFEELRAAWNIRLIDTSVRGWEMFIVGTYAVPPYPHLTVEIPVDSKDADAVQSWHLRAIAAQRSKRWRPVAQSAPRFPWLKYAARSTLVAGLVAAAIYDYTQGGSIAGAFALPLGAAAIALWLGSPPVVRSTEERFEPATDEARQYELARASGKVYEY